MPSTYYPPKYHEENFHCPRCNVYAKQSWRAALYSNGGMGYERTDMEMSDCWHCHKMSFWHNEKLVVPPISPVELPHEDLPENCREDYEEARSIFTQSPRSAAALLRLCLQKLMIHLGEKGKRIDEDIASLVENGLPIRIQQALDYCRVVGNNAVHPGEISIQDNPEIAAKLFPMINLIVENQITHPKEIEQLYDSLPEGAKQAIERRDKR